MKVILCGFQEIVWGNFFRDSTKQKGRLLFKSGHVGTVKETIDKEESILTGTCLSQVSLKSIYNISIKVSLYDALSILLRRVDLRCNGYGI